MLITFENNNKSLSIPNDSFIKKESSESKFDQSSLETSQPPTKGFFYYLAFPFVQIYQWIQKLFNCSSSNLSSTHTSDHFDEEEDFVDITVIPPLVSSSPQCFSSPTYSRMLPIVEEFIFKTFMPYTSPHSHLNVRKLITYSGTLGQNKKQDSAVLKNLLKLEQQPIFQQFCIIDLEGLKQCVNEKKSTTLNQNFILLKGGYEDICRRLIRFPIESKDSILFCIKTLLEKHLLPLQKDLTIPQKRVRFQI